MAEIPIPEKKTSKATNAKARKSSSTINIDDDLVIREVATNVWTFSKPFARFGFIPFGGRSTAIKLSSGDVWVLASTPLTPATKEAIDKLGPVKWIMGADIVHYLYLAEFKKAYPNAKVVGVQPLVAKLKAKGLTLDGAYGSDGSDTKYGFEDEVHPIFYSLFNDLVNVQSKIQACYFSGYENKDVAWFHVASKSLIQADLLFNLPGNEQYSKTKKGNGKFPLISKLNPWSGFHKSFVWGLGKDKEAMRRDIKTVLSWNFEKIIPCHGDVIEKDAKKAWETAFSKFGIKSTSASADSGDDSDADSA